MISCNKDFTGFDDYVAEKKAQAEQALMELTVQHDELKKRAGALGVLITLQEDGKKKYSRQRKKSKLNVKRYLNR